MGQIPHRTKPIKLSYKRDHTIIPYEETKRGWDKAAATNPNSAIHPAGLKGLDKYEESGGYDVQEIVANLAAHGVSLKDMVGSTIVDFGCGNGRVSIPLAYTFLSVYAVDFSYAMLQQIPKSEKIQPVLSVDNWFGLSEPADYTFSISVFIHNTYESGMQMMKAISDNMKVGGIALLQIPIYEYSRTPQSWVDVGVWTLEGLNKACENSGFEILEAALNEGEFSFSNIGPNHHKFQVLKKIS